MKTTLPIIGIDPGVSGGGIAVFENKKIATYKMPESLKDIMDVLRPFRGSQGDDQIRCSVERLSSRPTFDPFANKRMEPMTINYNRIKDALVLLDIPYREVSPITWQKWNGLVLPKGKREKGLDKEYDELIELKKDQLILPKHLAIARNRKTDKSIEGDIRYILEMDGQLAARKALNDKFTYFGLNSLKNAQKEIEKDIKKINDKIKRYRKNRYKDKASAMLGRKVTLWEADAILILNYEFHHE